VGLSGKTKEHHLDKPDFQSVFVICSLRRETLLKSSQVIPGLREEKSNPGWPIKNQPELTRAAYSGSF
jgi:hypothetical protein